ncbi:hypothetical protein HHI36_008093 [Cryptolaemus montrouzieri]|uniref:Uncharacterized protein n=1 Tax=Cryptolaemus montrouzieri TaxID=559131 RepID=A0ABD2MRM0_9CUCU
MIRAEGDFLYNTRQELNIKGDLILVRRPNTFKKRNVTHFRPCGSCGGMYSKLSLAAHFRKCKENRVKGVKDVILSSKKKAMYISETASNILKNRIFPHLREDDISKEIMSDETIILFGNRLCQKYRSAHMKKMIRAKLRTVGKFFLTFKKICGSESIKLQEVFDPPHYDACIASINEMCKMDVNTGRYASPATAFAIGSYLKKIAFYLEGLSHEVNKTVLENQKEQKRKKITLPSTKDIRSLKTYLEKRQHVHLEKLKEKFKFEVWKDLLGVTLTLVQLFNRRRAGEIERVEIDDFLQYERFNENNEMMVNLNMREKLNSTIIGQAGVDPNNVYLFGLPGSTEAHLSATSLMREFSILCGAQNPESLRGTELRKHIATKCSTMDLGNTEIRDIAEYLGHHEKIHLDHYRVPNAVKDIVRISNILEKAQDSQDENLIDVDNGHHSNMEHISHNPNVFDTNSAVYHADIVLPSVSDQMNVSSRLSWSIDEKSLVHKEAAFYLNNLEQAPLEYCQQLISKHNSLKRRSANSLKAFISNEIKRRKKQLLNPGTPSIRKGTRKYWSNNEKMMVMKHFESYLTTNTLPSLRVCKTIIDKIRNLGENSRNVESLHLQFDEKKN